MLWEGFHVVGCIDIPDMLLEYIMISVGCLFNILFATFMTLNDVDDIVTVANIAGGNA